MTIFYIQNCSKLIIRLSAYFIHAAQWDWFYSDPTPALCGDNNSTMKNSASICTSMMPTVTELIVSQFKEQLRYGRMTPLHTEINQKISVRFGGNS